MRRILAVTAAIVLMASLLTPVLADRGGQGGNPGNGPAAPGQGIEPAGDRDGEQDNAVDPAAHGDPEPRNGRGPSDNRPQDDEGDEPEEGGNLRKPDNSNRQETPPGEAVSAAVRSRFTSEHETTENVHRVRVQLQGEGTGEPDEGKQDADDDGETDDEAGLTKNLAQRIWAWQRALQVSAKRLQEINNGVEPFMMVGQPEIDEDGALVITVWKGNRLVRDHLYAADASVITVDPAGEIRLVDASGVTVCAPAEEPDCLANWLAAHPDAYISVWGRVEPNEDDQEVFIAYRITATDPDIKRDHATATATPTQTETIPAPTPTPTPIESETVPAPTPTSTPAG